MFFVFWILCPILQISYKSHINIYIVISFIPFQKLYMYVISKKKNGKSEIRNDNQNKQIKLPLDIRTDNLSQSAPNRYR